MADGSRNNPADVHRTSRTSLQFHHNNRHNVSHPIPKHTDKSQHRITHHNPRGFLTFQCDLPSAGPQPMCHTAGGRSLCGIYGRGSTTHAAYTAGVPQSMRYIRRGLRNLYYATIYPTEIYKVPFDIFRLSVELPIQKHTDTS